VWKLVGPLVSVHRLVLFFSNVYRFPDPPVHSVAFSVDHLGVESFELYPRLYVVDTQIYGFCRPGNTDSLQKRVAVSLLSLIGCVPIDFS